MKFLIMMRKSSLLYFLNIFSKSTTLSNVYHKNASLNVEEFNLEF